MVTFGLAMLFNRSDVFVIIATTEILVLSAASHLRISYVKEGLFCLVVWYGLMMLKAFTYVILLLFPSGWEGVKFYQPDLNTTAFVCYWVVPLICFMGSFLTVKDEEIKKIALILASAVGCAGLFMAFLLIKMFMLGESIYQIDVYDYTLITVILLLSIFAVKNKLSNIIPGVYFLAIARLVVMSTIIFDDFFNFGAFSYGGVMFIFGVPLVLMIVLAYCEINVCRLFVVDKLICSVILLTALVNVGLFHTPWFGDLASLGGGAVFIYSVVWFVLGVIWMILAFYYKELIKPAFGMIYFVIAKVFLYDVANLNDFWRIVALFALAGSLLAVSHFYTKNFKQESLS